MAIEERRRRPGEERARENSALALEWRRLTRVATAVAILTSPALFSLLYIVDKWALPWAIVGTFFGIIAFRGLVDVLCNKLIPRASLYGAGRELLQDDVVARRRLWYWRSRWRQIIYLAAFILLPLELLSLALGTSIGGMWHTVSHFVSNPQIYFSLIVLGAQLPLLFFGNLFILFGPMLFFGLRQMKGYEPGDADWGVKLDDIRGQREPKEEVTRVISLWQSGDDFRKAGGKPERGLLFLGAPGTGKTMLSKGIATSFNSPIVMMPGSGFAQMFMGLDVIIVMFLIRKARKLARKWGGTCMIFIDEIDAVGLRRQALGAGTAQELPRSVEELGFYGMWGARNSSEDIIIETSLWRDRLFASRAEPPRPVFPPMLAAAQEKLASFVFPGSMMGGGMGGGMALNQLLIQMDGVDDAPLLKKFFTNRFNTFLDATYLVPRQIRGKRLRLRPVKPRPEQIYFIGATNVPLDRLDPALLRPGRMGRHIYFRTPSKKDRADIFDLYLGKVSHEPDLDTERRRDELARITNGYSPAMIEQVCSMALTFAHSDGRMEFGWPDIVEAITTIESGTAQNIEYMPEQSRATAIHEAGHAIAAHLYMDNIEHSRLSIRKRGSSLGHYQGKHRDERLAGGEFRHEEVASLVMILGAMAAEHVFYGENSTGVGGDVQMITRSAAYLVGMAAMGAEPIDLTGLVPEDEREDREQELMKRFERYGLQIMNRANANPMMGDSVMSVLSDQFKRRAAAQMIGQAYITALACMRHNREAVARIAEELVQRQELYGDEVAEILDAVELEPPTIDLLDPALWPKTA